MKKKKRRSKGTRKPRDVTSKINKDFNLNIQERKYKKVKQKIKGKVRYVKREYYKSISINKFRSDRYYRIYLLHKQSKQKRLFGIGRFNNIPIFSQHPDSFNKRLGGRWFKPTKKEIKKRGNWIPVSSIIGDIERELETYGKDRQEEVRGAIIPPKNYYHIDWMIFSDKPIKGSTKWKKFGISVVIEYLYTNQQWISKRTIVIDNKKGIAVKNLHKYKDRWLFELSHKLDELKQNRRGQINVLDINGFIPLAY